MRDLLQRVTATVAVAMSIVAIALSAPARACGCGAYIPDRPGATVATERALIAWDGEHQDIVMSFQVTGASDTAAWIMPVPAPAEVSLGDPAVFTELGRLTAPRVEYRDNWWPRFDWFASDSDAAATEGARTGAGVSVLGRQRIGPFDVARLAADDSRGLTQWLSDNGFRAATGLDENLAGYVRDRWEVVAVKLVPGEGTPTLTGDLQPLRLSFVSDTVVYPMRLSRSARTPQSIDLYVLAQHRMEPVRTPLPDGVPNLEFAGPISGSSPALEPFTARGAYLTRWSDFIGDPEQIDGDYVFTRASDDAPYQRVISITRDRGDVAGAVILILVALGSVSLTVLVARRARRR